jgi:thiosulfate/3-mercaptopyruvate sulfurtransferase
VAFTTIISTDALALHLDDSAYVIVDCRYNLDDEEWGAREYMARHIPGAIYAHLGRDLAGKKTGTNGRHPLPDPEALRRTFGRLGIASGVQVVAYDQNIGMFASRLWWLLRWMGHEAVAVLDGGFQKWTQEQRATRVGEEHNTLREFIGAPRVGWTMSAGDVAARSRKPDWRIVDARAPERFRGETEPIDRVAGHIPGAANHFYKLNLDDRGIFRTPEEIRRALLESVGDVPSDRIICYCGSGVSACHNLLALEHAGLRGAKLYPGSWSEWSSDPARPVETAAAPVNTASTENA